MSDPWGDLDPDTQRWMDHVRTELVPMIRKSRVTVSLIPNKARDVDIKFAVELGLSIMLDKPIIAVIAPGLKVSDHLLRVVDEVVEWDGNGDPSANERLVQAIMRVGDDG